VAQFYKQKSEKLVSYKEAATEIRDRMDIFETIINVLKPKGLIKFLGGGDKAAPLSNRSNPDKLTSIMKPYDA
jgi:hypothetical protein